MASDVFFETKIDVPDYNDSFVRFKMNGKEYQLRFSWNDTEQRWYFGVFTALREPIFQGVKIVPKTSLNLFSGIDEMLGFTFTAVSENETIGRDDFKNGTAKFVYARFGD